MSLEPSDVRTAAMLIAYALSPSKRPTNDPDYDRVIRSYRDDPSVQLAANELCAGLGLRLIDVSDFGATVGALAESPFAFALADYKENLSGDERLLHGLVQVGLAAYLYPRAEDLEADADVRQVSVSELEAFLRETSEAAARSAPESADAPAEFPDLETAFRVYLRWPSAKETADGRRAAKTTQSIITHVLERLCEHGLMQKVRLSSGETFRALRRYRVQVRELASHEALRILRAAREAR